MAGRHCLRYTDSSVMRLARPTAIFIALLAASSLSPPRSDAQAATITLGYYDAKPSCFRDERGEPRGVFIDILKEVARREGWHPVFRFETWDELLEGLKSGSADLVPAIVRTEARDRFAVFTEESVMSDWGAVFSRPGSGLSSILDLGGKRVGALENDFWFSGPGSLKELCSSFGVTPDYRYFADYSALFHALANGDIDAAAGSNSLGIIWTPQLPVVATSIVYNPIELRFAASRAAPGGPALIEELDRNLAAIRQDSPEVFSSALAAYQIPLRREFRSPPWLLLLLAATSLVLVIVVLLLVVQRRALRAGERRWRGFFEDSPISIWEEDFSEVKRRVDAARASGVEDWEAYFRADERVNEFVSLIRVVDVNQATLHLLGYARKSDVLEQLSKVVSGENMTALRPELVALARGRSSFEGEAVHLNAAGLRLRVHFKLSVMPGFEESWGRVLVSIVDLSERVKAEEALVQSLAEKELLLREVHHRVKNNLQIICSLINLQLHEGDVSLQAGRSLVDMEARVRAMSLVHEILYQSDNFASVAFSSYIETLCDHLREAYMVESMRVQIDVEVADVRLPLEKAIPCGLLVNELVVNALKHAFPDGREGRIRVSMAARHRGVVVLSVRDNGVGMSASVMADEERKTIGVSLVRSLAGQLGGSLEVELLDGVETRVSFPA